MEGHKEYAAIVLRNIYHTADSVQYQPVADALLSGGVPLRETSLLAYDDEASVISALARLSALCDGVFLICPRALLSSGRKFIGRAAGEDFRGDILERDDCLYAVLPAGEKGAELVKSTVLPAINRRRGCRYDRVVLRTVCAPVPKLLSAIAAAQEASEGLLDLHASERNGLGRIELVYHQNTPKMTVDEAVRNLAEELRDYLYAMEDVELAARLVDTLALHKLRISTAESFTGGGVGRAIVSVPGASRVFYEGINAYDAEAKKARLSVSDYTIKTKGTISGETAYEMAAGLLREGHCEVAVATTGLAGPLSDEGKPVGLCYIAVGTSERVRVCEYRLEGSREEITETAINLALFLAFKEANQ